MDRRRFLKLSGAGVAGVFLLTAVGAGDVLAQAPSALEREFEKAAKEHEVPVEILLATGYVNTRWEMPPPEASEYEESEPGLGSPDGRGVYGIMALTENPRSDFLGEAARLTRASREVLKTERAANIAGGAAVLGRIVGEDKPAGLNGWYGALAEYGGGAVYADQVFETLGTGASSTTSEGERVTLKPQTDVRTPERRFALAAGEYPGSEFVAAHPDNYGVSSRESTYNMDKVIVHVAQGSYSGTLSHFATAGVYASAHYTVRSADGKVGQSVREKDVGYHAGNLAYNRASIGIEHEGFVSDPNRWFTDAMYRSSARLTAYLCKKYDIPIDRAHVIGHNEVPDPDDPGRYGGIDNHTDPGGGWNWTKYMTYVREAAGTATTTAHPVTPAPTTKPVASPTYSTVVGNGTAGRFFASGDWKLGNFNSQRYGADFRYATPKAVSDLATFKISVPATGQYDVFAWWPAHSSYNPAAPIQISTTTGVRTLKLNQRISGGRWVYLGAFTLGKGDGGYIRMSRWTASAGPIFADAVRIARR
ncbi:golvesin C-terminal-like domain-containing protein [Rubrobacter marinus]|nr:N-acetylmuramoyl-L-alanine amidase [Rubrobacter marinus]